ncbi:hypothetical protein AWZ03_014693 [Drosophila navojoa]|uniref:TATA box-binding protein-like 1 n=2 Tax=Drosophila navojoa TaxID=7232 RepID=A0A484ATN4_DRONA|nr:hypothetical protein AWZ03_014693 [Drosophila navojoa]
MVSIPAANLNGGLKASNGSGTVVGVGVAGTVLANGQRVFLTPASSYHLAARQATVSGSVTSSMGMGMVSTSKGASSSSLGGVGGGSNATVASSTSTTAGTVRYFSQFSKLQPVQQLQNSAGQLKLLNGDTMVLVNGTKPLIFASPNSKLLTTTTATTISASSAEATTTATATTTAATTTVPNGNRVLMNKQQQLQIQQQQQQQPATVIDEAQHGEPQLEDDGDIIQIKQEDGQQPQQQQQGDPMAASKATDPDAEPELDIVINNVVCSFSVRCHLKLREIALNGSNVEYRRENGMVTMKLRRPYTTASIWSSGRITCTGATSESQAKIAARRYARCLSKLGFPTHFQNFRIVNVLGTCSMPWAIKIVNFSERHRDNASYEPELHPGVTYKMREPKATLKIFSTGSITVTAASVNDVESAIQHIYPLVHEFRKQRSAEELQQLRQKNRAGEELSEQEQQLASEGKSQDKDDEFLNPSATHSEAGSTLYSSSPYATRRTEQVTSSSTSSGGDNICANARRRATECWATKLQNKRPRYNDPGSTTTASAGHMGRAGSSTVVSGSYSANFSAIGVAGGSAASATTGQLRLGKPLVPVDVVLKQSSSRARNAAIGVTAGDNGFYTKRETFSPTDFQVDDLIEEDDDELGMHF